MKRMKSKDGVVFPGCVRASTKIVLQARVKVGELRERKEKKNGGKKNVRIVKITKQNDIYRVVKIRVEVEKRLEELKRFIYIDNRSTFRLILQYEIFLWENFENINEMIFLLIVYLFSTMNI